LAIERLRRDDYFRETLVRSMGFAPHVRLISNDYERTEQWEASS
jgi:hypothetical protein